MANASFQCFCFAGILLVSREFDCATSSKPPDFSAISAVWSREQSSTDYHFQQMR
jgi:hypothetical protein